jgi:carboxymethylenebutenolidase
MRDLGRGTGGAFARIDAARTWLAGQPFVDASRLGVAGFCMGGGFALLDAARAPYGAAAVFYGQLPKEETAFDGICPIVAGYGGRDRSLKKAPARLEAALTARAVDHDIKVYPKAGHGYLSAHEGLFAWLNRHGPLKVGFNEAAAEDSWARVEQFFRRHLGDQV